MTLPVGLVGTGVYATEEETQRLMVLANTARKTPVILLFGKTDVSAQAWERANTAVHECALAHDLPEIKGFYGLAEDGEFIKQAGE